MVLESAFSHKKSDKQALCVCIEDTEAADTMPCARLVKSCHSVSLGLDASVIY